MTYDSTPRLDKISPPDTRTPAEWSTRTACHRCGAILRIDQAHRYRCPGCGTSGNWRTLARLTHPNRRQKRHRR